jgi:hypothetical protein
MIVPTDTSFGLTRRPGYTLGAFGLPITLGLATAAELAVTALT